MYLYVAMFQYLAYTFVNIYTINLPEMKSCIKTKGISYDKKHLQHFQHI